MKATVLLVDDEDLVREELGGLLEDEGYTVMTARDGVEGLELFIEHSPDMVVTDARMPRREGLSLAREILARDAHVPITMITGHGSESMAIEALRLGITDFLKKPVELTDLVASLERMEGALRLSLERGDGTEDLPDNVALESITKRYALSNSLDEIPPFVTALIRDLAGDLDSRKQDGLKLALREILLNAVEHGNLRVTYDEKTQANEQGTLAALIAARVEEPELGSRKVRVKATRHADKLTLVVEDEGEGFDWRKLPDPTDASNLLRTHGRGVLLASLSVDELQFNDKGNRVGLIAKVEQNAEDASDSESST